MAVAAARWHGCRPLGPLLLVLAAASMVTVTASRSCVLGLQPGTTALFVADPGTFSSTPEAKWYLANLKDRRPIPAGEVACPQVNVGTIMRQPVVVVLTGIGPTAAALCVFDVLQRCGGQIKDLFYSGTSGWSPQLGGVINADACDAANANVQQRARIGDVCVSPFTVNWDCRESSWLQTAGGAPNQCTLPAQNPVGPANSSLFGECMFPNATKRDRALADELIAAVAATNAAKVPRRNSVVQAEEVAYWAAMANGTQLTYPPLSQSAAPTVWDYKRCMEIDSQYFWSGAPWEMISRLYISETLNAASPPLGGRFTPRDVLAVSAMEGIGLTMAMQRYHGLASTKRHIPFTLVRGMSDWVFTPLIHEAGSTLWLQGPMVGNFDSGYSYAIATSSAVVLTLLQARCEAAASPYAGPAGSRPPPCSFTVAYP